MKKLAGEVEGTASWCTNVSNEFGQVLNSVFTTGEGVGLEKMAQGIVERYQTAGVAPPEILYVDRECCKKDGPPKPLTVCKVELLKDI